MQKAMTLLLRCVLFGAIFLICGRGFGLAAEVPGLSGLVSTLKKIEMEFKSQSTQAGKTLDYYQQAYDQAERQVDRAAREVRIADKNYLKVGKAWLKARNAIDQYHRSRRGVYTEKGLRLLKIARAKFEIAKKVATSDVTNAKTKHNAANEKLGEIKKQIGSPLGEYNVAKAGLSTIARVLSKIREVQQADNGPTGDQVAYFKNLSEKVAELVRELAGLALYNDLGRKEFTDEMKNWTTKLGSTSIRLISDHLLAQEIKKLNLATNITGLTRKDRNVVLQLYHMAASSDDERNFLRAFDALRDSTNVESGPRRVEAEGTGVSLQEFGPPDANGIRDYVIIDSNNNAVIQIDEGNEPRAWDPGDVFEKLYGDVANDINNNINNQNAGGNTGGGAGGGGLNSNGTARGVILNNFGPNELFIISDRAEGANFTFPQNNSGFDLSGMDTAVFICNSFAGIGSPFTDNNIDLGFNAQVGGVTPTVGAPSFQFQNVNVQLSHPATGATATPTACRGFAEP